jgi:hypothetical protein
MIARFILKHKETSVKKLVLIPLFLVGLPSFSLAQSYQPPFEFNLFGGYAVTCVKGSTFYGNTWSSYFGQFSPINETTTIDLKSNNGAFFGGGFSFFFSPKFGLQLTGGFLTTAVPNTSNFQFSFRKVSDGQTYTDNFAWDGMGTLHTIPISLNLIAKFGNERIAGYVSAGPTVFLNSFEAASSFGFGVESPYSKLFIGFTYEVDRIDALQVGLNIPSMNWTGIGGDFGAGFIYSVSPSLGLTLDARYYLCPEKEWPWAFQLGDYNGLLNVLNNFPFQQDRVDHVLGLSSFTTKVNPSFFKISAGINIGFGN